ncbi:MAG: hypothetical protein JOZ60_07935 [Verrucomicrobia bacterium]|nr:hypothetical protein [Verrucomicrobiota bacterium]
MRLIPLPLSELLASLFQCPKVPCRLIQRPEFTMSKSPPIISTAIDTRFNVDATIFSTGLGST